MFLPGGLRASGELGGLLPQRHSTGSLHTLAPGGEPQPYCPPGTHPPTKVTLKTSLSVHTHAPKTHTDAKQQGGISIHAFYCEYAYCLLYVCG